MFERFNYSTSDISAAVYSQPEQLRDNREVGAKWVQPLRDLTVEIYQERQITAHYVSLAALLLQRPSGLGRAPQDEKSRA